MKNAYKIIDIALVAFLVGCANPELKGAIRPLNPFAVPSVAVVTKTILSDAIVTELVDIGFMVIKRDKVYGALEEPSLKLKWASNDSKIIEAGKTLKVGALIFVSESCDTYIADRISSATIEIVDVETGAILGIFNYQNGKGGKPGSPADYKMKEPLAETASRIASEIGKAYGL